MKLLMAISVFLFILDITYYDNSFSASDDAEINIPRYVIISIRNKYYNPNLSSISMQLGTK